MPVTEVHLQKTIKLAKQYGAGKLVLFGSALDSPDTARDLDLACDIPGLKIFAFTGRLEDELELPVDVVPLTPENAFTHSVLQYGRVIYEDIDAARGVGH